MPYKTEKDLNCKLAPASGTLTTEMKLSAVSKSSTSLKQAVMPKLRLAVKPAGRVFQLDPSNEKKVSSMPNSPTSKANSPIAAYKVLEKANTIDDPFGIAKFDMTVVMSHLKDGALIAKLTDPLATAFAGMFGAVSVPTTASAPGPAATAVVPIVNNPKLGRLKPVKPQLDVSSASMRCAVAELCAACGGALRVGLIDAECVKCGLIAEGDPAACGEDEESRAGRTCGRLRIVGPNSGFYQPDLDRSSNGDSSAAARRRIFEEYITYRNAAIAQGFRVPPIDACAIAADMYLKIQQQLTKRKSSKQMIMAACLDQACGKINYAPDKAELAQMMQLQSRGIARGDNFIRMIESDGLIETDVNQDKAMPNVCTAFLKLGLSGPEYDPMRAAAIEIIKRTMTICVASQMRSRAYGAVYEILRRAYKTPRPKAANSLGIVKARAETATFDVFGKQLTLAEFTTRSGIRKGTIDRFIAPLASYRSHIADVYEGLGLKP